MPDPRCHQICDFDSSGQHSNACAVPVQTSLPVLIVSGTRDATAEDHLDLIDMAIYRSQVLLAGTSSPFHLVEGEANGVDKLSRVVALTRRSQWELDRVPARWAECGAGCPSGPHRRKNDTMCPVAGPRRNQLMLDRHPGAMVLAMPLVTGRQPVEQDSKGTWDLIRRAIAEGRRLLVEPLKPAEPQAPLW